MTEYVFDDTRTRRRTEEDIAVRADRRYFERGALDSHDVQDWREAEREVRESRRTRNASAEGEFFA